MTKKRLANKNTTRSSVSIEEIASLKRKLEVEAALERVRVRANAMRQSDQLKEVIQEVFNQLQGLGLNPHMCCIDIIQKNSKDLHLWVATPNADYPKEVVIPHFDNPIFTEYYAARTKRRVLHTANFSKEVKDAFFEFTFKNTGLKSASRKRKDFVFKGTSYTLSSAMTSNLSIWMVNYQGQVFSKEDNNILLKFTRVFDQCYTRFLDIKKAEEQAKEAEIEVALERIRTRALAMQSSEEILEVADVLREQMGLLGQAELATTAVHIYTEEAPTFDTWWTFTPPGNLKRNILSGISKIRIGTSAVAQEFIEKYRSKQGEYTVYATGKKLKDWQKELAFTTPELIKSYNQQLPTETYFHFSDFKGGALVLVSYQEPSEESKNLLKRSSSVFNLAYQRFQDLKKAEEQAREAQIEVALERVRARTMAMHRSDELAEIAEVLYVQLLELGIDSFSCGYVLMEEEEDQAVVWMTEPGGKSWDVWTVPLSEDTVLKGRHQSWKRKEKFHRSDLQGQDLTDHLTYIAGHTPLAPEEMEGFLSTLPDELVLTSLHFSHGYLLVVSKPPVTEEDEIMLIRFAKVFQLAYKRYLDLQGAEAQTREAEIELALERVRSRSMGMQNSHELAEILGLIFKELNTLDIDLARCIIWIIDPDTETATFWLASPYEEIGTRSYFIPKFNHTYYKQYIKAWKSREPLWKLEVHGKLKEKWHDYLFKETDLRNLPMDVIRSMRAPGKFYTINTFNKHGLICAAGTAPFSDESSDIFRRFGSVFEQCYTRFEDIKLAEEQTREAEIELSLERVRARTMAMQHSKELPEVALVIWEQLDELKLEGLPGCAIHVNDDNHGTFEAWAAFPDLIDGEIKTHNPHSHDQHCIWVYREWDKRYRAGETDFAVECNTKQLNEFIDWFAPYLPMIAEEMRGLQLDKLYVNGVAFSNGIIGSYSVEPLSEETWSVFKRLAAVFDLAYRRFEDLKKAEEQAREAEIELALERIRARTMAMQHSDELPEAAQLLFHQVQQLGIKAWSVGYNIWNEDKTGFISWMSDEGVLQPVLEYPVTEDPSMKHFLETYERGESFFVEEVGGEILAKHYEYLRTLPGVADSLDKAERAGYPVPTFQIFHLAYFSKGFLLFITYEPVPKAWDIFKRFGKVFEQTYTRFLDLKKAEEQTREAEVQLALERVRARAMAMQQSEELAEAAELLYRQLRELGIDPWTCGYVFIEEEKEQAKVWTTTPNGAFFWGLWSVPLSEEKVLKDRYQSWKKKEKIHISILKGQDNLDHHIYIAAHSPLTPEETKAFLSTLPTDLVLTSAHFSHGYLLVITESQLTNEQENLLTRFAKVFELTYTRFLDLEKSEEQARESEIELALERVRARTMAMQHSSELPEVALVIWEQLDELKLEGLPGCAIHVNDDDQGTFEAWAAFPDEVDGKIRTHNPHSHDQHCIWVYREWDKRYRAGEMGFAVECNTQQLNEFIDWFAPYLPMVAEEMRSQQLDKLYVNGVAFSNGIIGSYSIEPLSEETWSVFKRLAAVFDMAYRRFEDLKKSEEQTRESEIELAMERIRARTMAMQHSNELADASLLLAQQVKALGIETWGCAFHIYDQDADSASEWFSNAEEALPTYKLKLENIFLEYFQQGQQGNNLYIKTFKGKACQKHYQYLCTLPIVGETLKEMKAKGVPFPSFQMDHVAYFKYGHLLFITFKPVPEAHSIFTRMASVFETDLYPFPEDLRQAETQAREAQIEAALERVRSRTMAMQESEKMLEVGALLYNELFKLDIKSMTSGITLIDDDKKVDWYYMVAPPDGSMMKEPMGIPRDQTKVMRSLTSSWEKQEAFHIVQLNEKETIKHQTYIAENSINFALSAEELISFTPDRLTLQTFNFKHGYLLLVGGEKLSKDKVDITIRFAKVFEQTYTRFLDLKKAEEQAHKAQIEASLERVRSRTMGMHRSEELTEVAMLLNQELRKLDYPELFEVGYIRWDERANQQDGWLSDFKGKGMEPFSLPLKGDWVLDERYDAWKSQKSLLYQKIGGDQLLDHVSFCLPSIKPGKVKQQVKEHFSDPTHFYHSFFEEGALCVITQQPLSNEQQDLLQRFARVFKQTYTRFLDLKKAEEQAREAQIEAALERVRAKAMAMHSSEDLVQTVGQLFKELNSLEINLLRCGVGRVHKETRELELYTFSGAAKGDPVPVIGKAILQGHPVLNGCFRHWEKQEEYHPVLKGALLKKYYESIKANYKLPRKQDSHIQYGYFFPFSAGVLFTYTETKFNEEELSIFRKFNSVVGLTYRRFLDLMEAEAQAREAQIEASLERIRAQAMAMHSSEDLSETVGQLFNELNSLDINLLRCGVGRVHRDTRMVELFTFTGTERKEPVPVVGKVALRGHSVLNGFFEHWKEQKEYHFVLKGAKLKTYHQAIKSFYKLPGNQDSKPQYGYFFPFPVGLLYTFAEAPFTEEELSIFRKFSSVVGLTYRRFLDLTEAEAQAREAQIEVALERIRARALAMHNSDELMEVANVMREQMNLLGQPQLQTAAVHLYPEDGDVFESWLSLHPKDKTDDIITETVTFSKDQTQLGREMLAHYRSGDREYTMHVKGKPFKEWRQMAQESNPTLLKYWGDDIPDQIFWHFTDFSGGSFVMVSREPPTEESKALQSRVSATFDLAYRRFQDLKQAEGQAREAKIETALERVRARAMAMHSSDDLFSVAEVLHDQLAQLGQHELESSIIHIYPKHLTTIDVWYSYRSTIGKQVMDRTEVARNSCSWAQKVMELYESDETSYLIESRGKMLREWYHVLAAGVAPEVIEYDRSGKIIVPKVLYYYFSKFSGGALLMISEEPPAVEAKDMQQRAAAVFDLAYRRFLDLQKAESQAREAQIEAGLERVRASTMAMHSSEDVGIATKVLFQELENVGIETLRCGVSIIRENRTMEVWAASTSSGGEVFTVPGIVDMTFHPMVNQLFEYWKSGKEVFTYELKGKDAQRYYKSLENMPDYKVPMGKNLPDRHISNGFLFKHGALFAFTEDYFTKEASEIFQKFTNVFTLTYGRYLDLKQAEVREKEAVKQSSLDRVRAEIASMRTKEDLQRITPLIWRELGSLGVPFFRCGVFIIDETAETVHMYLSTPEGNPLAALHLGFDEQEIPLVQDAITHWKTQTVHTTHWDQQQFKTFTQSLKNRGLIKSLKTYQHGEKPPTNLNLHQVPFKQGMLYVGSSELLTEEQIQLVQALAGAFSVAYSRYEDFVQLEEAKANVENTLTELKSAQDQLIHSEKMASLGELTAGIAHEIQNPLNFVNNFAEVSGELLSELKEEMESANYEEVEELVEDLTQNLDKITHHGTRASSIVRGMLDHSRASSDEKVPTDINLLADEYLRLAYHGFRAKDKSFNANFKTDLAEDLPKIEVVAQDIGRVILNLVNNAFQAVRAVENPEVLVKTQAKDGTVEISVLDNGPGIPEDIKEKIFQPFFTTKAAGEGTGLGLSLSYDIVTKGHGGELKVGTPADGRRGTEFVIYLPS